MAYNETTINNIKDLLIDKGETIAVAESVTSGNLQAALSIATDAKQFFHGGITAYNLGQKARHLNVEPIHSEKVDCISEKVATTMAIEVGKMFTSNYGVGITGYATPVPGKVEDLYAIVAIARNNEIILCERMTSKGESTYAAQIDYTNQVIELLHNLVRK